MRREARLVGSAGIAATAGVATLVLATWAIMRPQIMVSEGTAGPAAGLRFHLVLALAAIVITFLLVVVLGMLSGMLVGSRVRRRPTWSVGVGAVGGGLLFVWASYQVGAMGAMIATFGGVAAIAGAVTGGVFWWLALRLPPG